MFSLWAQFEARERERERESPPGDSGVDQRLAAEARTPPAAGGAACMGQTLNPQPHFCCPVSVLQKQGKASELQGTHPGPLGASPEGNGPCGGRQGTQCPLQPLKDLEQGWGPAGCKSPRGDKASAGAELLQGCHQDRCLTSCLVAFREKFVKCVFLS